MLFFDMPGKFIYSAEKIMAGFTNGIGVCERLSRRSELADIVTRSVLSANLSGLLLVGNKILKLRNFG